MDLPPAAQCLLRTIGNTLVAVAVASAVAQSLRRAADRSRCRVERCAETSAEYIVRVVEDAAPGAPPLVFGRSSSSGRPSSRS